MNETKFQEKKKEKEGRDDVLRRPTSKLDHRSTIYFNRQAKRHKNKAPYIRLHQQSHVLSLFPPSRNCSSALKGPYTL